MPQQAPQVDMLPRPAWLETREWPFTVRSLPVDGHLVHVVDESRGPILLFVHTGTRSFVCAT